jgi:hypothetical protein
MPTPNAERQRAYQERTRLKASAFEILDGQRQARIAEALAELEAPYGLLQALEYWLRVHPACSAAPEEVLYGESGPGFTEMVIMWPGRGDAYQQTAAAMALRDFDPDACYTVAGDGSSGRVNPADHGLEEQFWRWAAVRPARTSA